MGDPTSETVLRDHVQEDHDSLPAKLGSWLRLVLRGRDTSAREAIEDLISANTGTNTGDGECSSLTANMRVLLSNILKLSDRTVVDAMVPRVDIIGLEVGTPFDEAVLKIVEEGHSRLPVYRENLDDVVGIIHIKDVMYCIAKERKPPLEEIAREVQIVAPSMPVLDLLVQMRQNHQHMALVVDEFGGIDGLVTIEDLVEEIVGEIQDEHDEEVEPTLTVRPDGTLLADARVAIEEFESKVGPVLSEDDREDADTLGGLVFSMAGRVPSRGELIQHSSGIEFEIVEADARRIKRLRVRLPPAEETGENSSRS
jgi:CBS domain containing-hemolysin-like protein